MLEFVVSHTGFLYTVRMNVSFGPAIDYSSSVLSIAQLMDSSVQAQLYVSYMMFCKECGILMLHKIYPELHFCG